MDFLGEDLAATVAESSDCSRKPFPFEGFFRHQLLDYGKRRNFRAILDIIPTFREQIAGQAKLQAPNLANGNPQDQLEENETKGKPTLWKRRVSGVGW